MNDWGSGFTGNLTITNTGSAPINGWTLSFDFVGSISSIWNASITSQVGNQYVIQNASYNAVIGAGAERDDRVQCLARPCRHQARPATC